MSGHRRQIDGAGPRRHQRHGCLRHQHLRRDVHGEDTVPMLRSQSSERAFAGDAGIVDELVAAAAPREEGRLVTYICSKIAA